MNTAGPSPESWARRSKPHDGYCAFTSKNPENRAPSQQRGQLALTVISAAPNVNADEEKQPYYVNEVPIPRCRFEAKMMVWFEMTIHSAE